MNRKQKKEQVRKLQNQCELIKKQAEKDIENAKELFSKKEDLYLEHIQILNKRLMDGKHYRTEKVCVNIDQKERLMMYQYVNMPKNVIDEYINQRTMDAILKELCKRTDLLQRTEHPGHTTFYMEVLKLDDRPIPTLTIPKEYAGSPFER